MDAQKNVVWKETFKGCERKAKWKDRELVGREFCFVILDALKNLGLGAYGLVYDDIGNVDFPLHVFNMELEAKRLRGSYILGKPWLFDNIVSRFSEDCLHKILVTTRKAWDDDGERYLEQNGIFTIVTGQIENDVEKCSATRSFVRNFVDLLVEIGDGN